MIINFKIFEAYNKKATAVLFVDNELMVYKNSLDEIIFKFKGHNYSLTTGVAKILGTKYENNEEIRNIIITNKPHGKTLNNNATKKSIAKIFLELLDYPTYYIDTNYLALSHKISVREIVKNSNTIGEFIDNMRELIHELRLEKNMNKYNL